MALVLAGSACGSGGGGVVVPAEAPAGRCAGSVSQGVYEWERCAWEPYRESADHNGAFSEAEAGALIARIWREVEVEGKPAAPPTSALVPRGTACPAGSLVLGCYDQAAHHIAYSDSFPETLLHEVAHALLRDHPQTEKCREVFRQAAGGRPIDQGPPEDDAAAFANSEYTRCSHGDFFRCVADRLFTDYAGIPSAGVCGTTPARPASPASPACPPLFVMGGAVLCGVEGTLWFRVEDPERENISWAYLDPKSHTLEYAETPTLDIFCESGSLGAYVYFGGLSVSGQPELGGRIPVRYELDGSPTDEAWDESDFGVEVFSPDPAAFAASLAASRELVFTAWNHDGSLVGTIVFDTTGADREVERVLTACGIS